MTLQDKYKKEIRGKLAKEFSIVNPHAVPGIEKIVVNMGIGDTIKDKKILETAKKDIANITGQAASVRPARISVASFNVRAGMPVGLKVTLRGSRMYIFLEKLITITLPRLRDFRGVSKKSFDKDGNYTLGIVEHTIFPEVAAGDSKPRGMEITLVTSTKNRKQAKRLLELIGIPFEKDE